MSIIDVSVTEDSLLVYLLLSSLKFESLKTVKNVSDFWRVGVAV